MIGRLIKDTKNGQIMVITAEKEKAVRYDNGTPEGRYVKDDFYVMYDVNTISYFDLHRDTVKVKLRNGDFVYYEEENKT